LHILQTNVGIQTNLDLPNNAKLSHQKLLLTECFKISALTMKPMWHFLKPFCMMEI